jgi:AGZA family xanthine/uracil permease-like MFS transporter
MIATGNEEYALASGLPIAPWLDESVTFGASGFEDVIFFGFASGENTETFSQMLINIFSNPEAYMAIFALILVNLFDTTATLVTVGKDCGLIGEDGNLIDGRKAMMVDATGALICAPLGTSTVTSFAESSIGASMGAKTGLASCTTGIMFLIAAFCYPLFSIFSYSCVTAPALVAVGIMIFSHAVKNMGENDSITLYSGVLTILMMVLTYSLANGLGIGIIAYVVMSFFARKKENLNPYVVGIAILFVINFAITAILNIL